MKYVGKEATTEDPFGSEPVEDVRLEPTPLVQVVAQVRFPPEPGLSTDPGIASVRAALKDAYPIARREQSLGLLITSKGATPEQGQQTVWRFQDRAAEWQVSVSDSFLALDTSTYVSRENFCDRWQSLLAMIEEEIEPLVYDRLGIRYINRFESNDLTRLRDFVRTEALGPLVIPTSNESALHRTLTEALFQVREGATLQARWGLLPAGVTTDPTIEPAAAASWLLDIDVFSSDGPQDFSSEELDVRSQRFAEDAYRFFRWIVTSAFVDERRQDA